MTQPQLVLGFAVPGICVFSAGNQYKVTFPLFWCDNAMVSQTCPVTRGWSWMDQKKLRDCWRLHGVGVQGRYLDLALGFGEILDWKRLCEAKWSWERWTPGIFNPKVSSRSLLMGLWRKRLNWWHCRDILSLHSFWRLLLWDWRDLIIVGRVRGWRCAMAMPGKGSECGTDLGSGIHSRNCVWPLWCHRHCWGRSTATALPPPAVSQEGIQSQNPIFHSAMTASAMKFQKIWKSHHFLRKLQLELDKFVFGSLFQVKLSWLHSEMKYLLVLHPFWVFWWFGFGFDFGFFVEFYVLFFSFLEGFRFFLWRFGVFVGFLFSLV